MSQTGAADESILVTGGAGYIGSALVSRLLDSGRSVRVFDPLLYGDSALAEFRAHPEFALFDGDPTNPDTARRAVDGVEKIVHLGALVGDPTCTLDPPFTCAANVEATQLLVDAACDADVGRFVFASSCSVYGSGERELDELAALAPKSLYAESKIAGEAIVLQAIGVQPVVLRFGTVFGASRRPRFDLVVNLLTAKAAAGEPIGIFGGEQWRPFVHIEDIVSAIVLALDADARLVAGEIFNVGSPDENRRLAEIGEIIAELIPGAPVEIDDSLIDRRDYRADFSKITSRLGFEAKWTLRDGIAQLLDTLDRNQISEYRDPVYSNDRSLTARLTAASALSFKFDRITAG
jgi:nucleoside-diphosphate-sugar epimerase